MLVQQCCKFEICFIVLLILTTTTTIVMAVIVTSLMNGTSLKIITTSTIVTIFWNENWKRNHAFGTKSKVVEVRIPSRVWLNFDV